MSKHVEHYHDGAHETGTLKKLFGRLRGSSIASKHSSESLASSILNSSTANHATSKPHSSASSHSSRHNKKRQVHEANVSLDLWNAAYNALRDDPACAGLVTAFETIISQELPDEVKLGGAVLFRGRSAEERLDLLTEITAAGLQKKRGSKGSQTDDAVRKILELSKNAIDSVWTVYPSTPVAWAGISTLTPLLLDPILARKDMRDGIVHITGRVVWYMQLAQLLIPSSWEDDRLFRSRQEDTRDAIVKLYRKVLELQMNCVCATASSWNAAAKNVVSWNAIGRIGLMIQEIDASLRKDIEQYGTVALKDPLLMQDGDLIWQSSAGQNDECTHVPNDAKDIRVTGN